MNVYELIYNIRNKEDFIFFINNLQEDNQVKNDEWENKDISSYLESISSWVEDMEGYYNNMKLDMPTNIDWKFIAMLFYIGKIYE
ncbi:MAG: hypothetical protein K2L07_04295 [Lachnospiraceae bacterium]|nr:hypothetical protein [Lachnospiraceae bacterium]